MARETREFCFRLVVGSPAVLFALELLDAGRLVQGVHGVDVAFRPVQKIHRCAVANLPRLRFICRSSPEAKRRAPAQDEMPDSLQIKWSVAMDYNRRVAGDSALIDWRRYCVHSC